MAREYNKSEQLVANLPQVEVITGRSKLVAEGAGQSARRGDIR